MGKPAPATNTQRSIAAGKKQRTKADRQAEQRARYEASKVAPAADGLAERMEASLAAKAAKAPPPAVPNDDEKVIPGVAGKVEAAIAAKIHAADTPAPRPAPAIGQVWSAQKNGEGARNYIRIVAIENGFALSVRITEGGVRIITEVLKREALRSALVGGVMPSCYRYEPTVSETETLDLSTERPDKGEENPMSANHSTSTATKVPGIPSTKKQLRATLKAVKTEKAVKTPKVPKEKKAAEYATEKARLTAWAKHAAERAEQAEASVETAKTRLKAAKTEGVVKTITAAEKKVEKAETFAKAMAVKAKKWAAAATASAKS